MRSLDDLIASFSALDIKVLRLSRESDVDCYTERPLSSLVPLLEKLGLTITKKKPDFMECLYLEGERLIPIEIATTLFRGAAFRRYQVREEFIAHYVADPESQQNPFHILKSLLCLTKLERLSKFRNREIEQVLDETLLRSPYKKNVRSWFYPTATMMLFNNAKPLAILDRYWTLGIRALSNYRSSKTMALVGPDGSGKSTLIAALAQYDALKPIYMGMGMEGLKSQRLIWILRKFSYAAMPVIHLVIFLEYWLRILQAQKLRLRGFDIIFDRYPTFDYTVSPSDFDRVLGKTLYRFCFPKPSVLFMLALPASTIVQRKTEMTVSDIELFYKRADGTRVIAIDNTGSVPAATMKILKVFYGFQK